MTWRSGHGNGAGVPRIEVQASLFDGRPTGQPAGASTLSQQARRRQAKGYVHGPLAVRFWRYVERSAGCWLWTGGCVAFGYGIISSGGRGGRMLRAHRVAWELHYGPIPPGMVVCHACDVPACVRPDHLFLGTIAANNRDCIAKRRHRGAVARETYLGERNGRSKLTADQVRDLRRRHEDGESQRSLSRRFGISKRSVQKIVRREHWRHVA